MPLQVVVVVRVRLEARLGPYVDPSLDQNTGTGRANSVVLPLTIGTWVNGL